MTWDEHNGRVTRILITGSADGLGLMAARLLIAQGHEVVLHARNPARAADARAAAPGSADVLVGDLSSMAEVRSVAEQADASGRFDAVVHNAAVGDQEPRRIVTVDGLAHVFAINTLAPYLLTALMTPPDRLVYLSSGMHRFGDDSLADLQWESRRWNGSQAYADSKLHDVLLAFAVARYWPDVRSNAVDPGWVATKMGGRGAPDDLDQAHRTQAWLAVEDDGTGGYYYHRERYESAPAATDPEIQDRLVATCAELTGTPLPR
jgi:NAD(P)-dependent dehydrogenase (short-subunit alcohol dehydrogenase family)